MITRLPYAIGVFQHIGYTRRPLFPWRPPPEAMPWRSVVSATRYFSGEYQQVRKKNIPMKKKMKTSSSVILQWHLPPLFLLAIDCLWSSHYTLLAPTKPHSVSLKTMWSPAPTQKNSPPPPQGDKYRLVPHHIQMSFPLTTPLPKTWKHIVI